MKKTSLITVLALLSGCAFNVVLEPYYFNGSGMNQPPEVAKVWGMLDGDSILFKKINGKSLPSRGGGGIPASVSLLPGKYEVELLYQKPALVSKYITVNISVDAGHTYVIEKIGDGRDVSLQVKDFGAEKTCRFERYEQIKGNSKLICL